MIPRVSVCLIVYNHEPFIKQAIDSILEQKCSFDYEIVIGEDFSLDNSREICKKYQRKYPERIRLLHRDSNLGMTRNIDDALNQCRGEFIAFIEGDDYWTSPNKLQRQVEILDNDPNLAFCFHNALIINEEGTDTGYLFSEGRKIDGIDQALLSTEDLLSAPIRVVHLASTMFRNKYFKAIDFPQWYWNSPVVDLVLFAFLSNFGRAYYFNEPWCIYRKHSGGITNRPFDKNYFNRLKELFHQINDHLGGRYSSAIRYGIGGRKIMWINSLMTQAKKDRKLMTFLFNWINLLLNKKYTHFTYRDYFWMVKNYFKK